MTEPVLSLNGVNGATGEFFTQPSRQELADWILGKALPAVVVRAVMPGVRPRNLESAGWGVLFAEDTDPAIKEALRPLLEHRRNLVSRGDSRRYHEYAGTDGLWQDESKSRFLARHGIGPGPVNPEKVPYYLLLVGGPEKIPFAFQHQLGVQYAVGRVAFETPEEYEQYALNVVEAETRLEPQARRATFFGVQNPDDAGTRHSSQYLLQPLVKGLSEDRKNWQIDLKTTPARFSKKRKRAGSSIRSRIFKTSKMQGS